jgi:hypothetical protein
MNVFGLGHVQLLEKHCSILKIVTLAMTPPRLLQTPESEGYLGFCPLSILHARPVEA